MHDLITLDPAASGGGLSTDLLSMAEINAVLEFARNEKSAATREAYASD